jgi:hypothetical protein
VALDQVATVGHRLRDRGQGGRSEDLARAWLVATELTAGRAALAVADLASCIRRLEATGASRERVVDLIWSSTTDEMDDIRTQLYSKARAASDPAVADARAAGR